MTDYTALDDEICIYLSKHGGHPTYSWKLSEIAGSWRLIDRRMQAMRKAGRIKWHGGGRKKHPPGVKAHGWEVITTAAPQPPSRKSSPSLNSRPLG